MNMNYILAAEMEMVKGWENISANTIKALKIMGMGLLAIFIVIAIIIVAVSILNVCDKKSAEKKAKREAAAEAPSEAPLVAPTKAIESKSAPVVESVTPEDNTVSRSDLDDPKYRKGQEDLTDPKYRKED